MSNDVRRRIHQDFGERTTTFEIRQDVEPYLEQNARWRGEEQPNTDGLKHVASIPVVVLEQWLNEEFAKGNTSITMASREFDELIQRKLKDHDWLFLRTDKPPPAHRR